MALKLKGSTSGFVAIDAPSVAGNNTLILPENTGSAHQILANDITAGVTTFTQITVSRNGDLTVPGTISIGGTLTYEDVTSVDSVGIVTARGLSIFGNTTGLQVASGISTFQALTGTTGTFSGDVDIADKIVHTGDTNTAIRFPAADTFTVETGGSERFRVASDGRIRINCTAQPSATVAGVQFDGGSYNGSVRISQGGGTSGTDAAGINVYGGQNGTGIGAAAAMGAVLNLVNTNNTDNNQTSVDFSNSNSLSIAKVIGKNDSHSNRTGSLIFSTSNSAAPTEKMRITGDGMVLMGTTTEGHSSADDLTVATSGNTGITLRSGTSSAGNIYFSDATSGSGEYIGYISYSHSTNALSFGAGDGSERARIDSSGRLLVGSTAARDLGGLSSQKIAIEDTSGAACLGIINNQNSTGFPSLRFAKSRGTSVGSNTVVQSGDPLGGIVFCGADGTDMVSVGAQIICDVDGTPGSNDMPGRLEFHTTADGAASPTERMRIDSTGNTHFGSSGTLNSAGTVSIVPADGLINFGMDGRSSFVTGQNSCYIYSGDGVSGTTVAGDLILQSRSNQNRTIRFVVGDGNASPTPVQMARIDQYGIYVNGTVSGKAASLTASKAGNFDPYVFDVNGAAQSTETVAIKAQKNDCLDLTRYYTSGTIQTFRFNNDFTGRIETGTTSVTYHTSSDYRLKENAVSISDGITRLKQLKPYKFNFIKEPSVIHDGFFAHEVTPVVPTAVSGEKDATETRYYETGDVLPEGKEIGDIKEENAVLPQSLDHSKLVPLLTAALQEAITEIETLKTRVAALEG